MLRVNRLEVMWSSLKEGREWKMYGLQIKIYSRSKKTEGNVHKALISCCLAPFVVIGYQ